MTILFKQRDYDKVLSYTQKNLPNEACGLLAGYIDGEIKRIEKVYYLTNVDQSPEHFSMDPQEQFTAIMEIRSKGWVLLGNFHSHPSSLSRPSQKDIHLAFDADVSYLILSIQDKEHPVFKSFQIKDKLVTEEELRLI